MTDVKFILNHVLLQSLLIVRILVCHKLTKCHLHTIRLISLYLALKEADFFFFFARFLPSSDNVIVKSRQERRESEGLGSESNPSCCIQPCDISSPCELNWHPCFFIKWS